MENLQGEFLYKGKWIPNQFSFKGAENILRAAFRDDTIEPFYVGLCNVNLADTYPQADLAAFSTMNEPAATNGYERQLLARDTTDWPIYGQINNETYIESKDILFTATGAYSKVSSRFFLLSGVFVWAVSSAFPDGPTTIDETFSTKYRLYLR
jgi:hypothetical protein